MRGKGTKKSRRGLSGTQMPMWVFYQRGQTWAQIKVLKMNRWRLLIKENDEGVEIRVLDFRKVTKYYPFCPLQLSKFLLSHPQNQNYNALDV